MPVVPFKTRALYDFEGQKETGEINIKCGDIITVSRTDIGEGWWHGTNPYGESGLFPEAYVEEIASSEDNECPPMIAPPPLPQDYELHDSQGLSLATSSVGASHTGNVPNDSEDWGNSEWGLPSQKTVYPPPGDEYENDDWDSDWEETPNYQTTQSAVVARPPPPQATSTFAEISNPNDEKKKGVPSSVALAAGGFSRFSLLVKSGAENYVLGKCQFQVRDEELLYIVDNGDGKFSWKTNAKPYTCKIDDPKKESKMKGFKSFIAYQLTPSFSGIHVYRRFKRFDWLHERLVSKFLYVPIPPLPDKQFQGRYEGEFIEHRMNQLQNFVNRICRHPILSQCDVWQHFLTCTDDKRWKSGKRQAEKDQLVGGANFLTIRVPDKAIDQEFLDHQMDVFNKFTTSFDVAVKNMIKTVAEQTQKFQQNYKKEFQNIGKAFGQMGAAFNNDGQNNYAGLNNAVIITSEAYEDIGKLFEEQPRRDWERLGDVMHDYRGLLAFLPNIINIHTGAIAKGKELEKLASEGKLSSGEFSSMKSRIDTMSYTLLVEINTFHKQRVEDMTNCHKNFIKEQINFYQKIIERLEDALEKFDEH